MAEPFFLQQTNKRTFLALYRKSHKYAFGRNRKLERDGEFKKALKKFENIGMQCVMTDWKGLVT